MAPMPNPQVSRGTGAARGLRKKPIPMLPACKPAKIYIVRHRHRGSRPFLGVLRASWFIFCSIFKEKIALVLRSSADKQKQKRCTNKENLLPSGKKVEPSTVEPLLNMCTYAQTPPAQSRQNKLSNVAYLLRNGVL